MWILTSRPSIGCGCSIGGTGGSHPDIVGSSLHTCSGVFSSLHAILPALRLCVQFLISDSGIGVVVSSFAAVWFCLPPSPATPGCGIRISEPSIGDSGSEH